MEQIYHPSRLVKIGHFFTVVLTLRFLEVRMHSIKKRIAGFVVCVILFVPHCAHSADGEIYWEPYSFKKEKQLIQGNFGRILVPENRKKTDSAMPITSG